MVLDINVPVYTIKKPTVYKYEISGKESFPILVIDKDSYIVKATIQSFIDFNWDRGRHNLQIGRYSSLAEDIRFMIDTNHEYDAVFSGVVSELQGEAKTYKSTMRPRGESIIQNDCWIGHGATIMDGVTIHNGAVVGTNAVVTKDVPPYAIVAGNPARVVKYRFDEDIIHKLQHIAWWDWDSETIIKYKDKLLGETKDFVDYFYRDDMHKKEVQINRVTQGKAFVFYLDMNEPYCIWRKVIRQFAETMNGTDSELILYLNPNEADFEAYAEQVLVELALYEEYECYVNICTDAFEDDADLLQIADYYISNRHTSNVHRMCKAELYGAKCLIGVRNLLFQ